MTKREKMIELFMLKENACKETFEKLEIITYDPLCVAIFRPRQIKPMYHYRFSTPEKRDAFIIGCKGCRTKEADVERVREAQYSKDKEKFTPGTILYSSWGYEQTNIDFYKILERKKDFVIIQEVGQKKEYGHHGDRGDCVANPDVLIGEPMRKKISKYATINLSSFQSASVWDGRSLYWSSYA